YQLAGDNLLFSANVKAQSEAVYTLKKGTPATMEALAYAAQKMPEKRNDIAWENDLATYRMYCKTLLSAEPNTSNGVDIWFKKQAAPMIDKMFTYENYHSEQIEGVDAYSVNGKTLGAGGIAAFVDDSLWLHAPYDECEIIANGPLRSEFILHYHNVEIAGDLYCKTVRISTQANGLLNKAVVKYEGKDKPMQLAAGIYLHTNQAPHIPNGVEMADEEIIAYAENPSEGHVTSPDPRMYIGVYMPEATDTLTYNHQLLILRNYTVGTEITYYFGGGWNIFPAGRYAADNDWLKALLQFKEMINNPLY
ncbi:MAG: DUF4861 domain-containing protein, partial [Dysgonamonadaceae bacterium]|nr:DUF4861 domain-containing protein [Dysgonamonadaceae bacterium]